MEEDKNEKDITSTSKPSNPNKRPAEEESESPHKRANVELEDPGFSPSSGSSVPDSSKGASNPQSSHKSKTTEPDNSNEESSKKTGLQDIFKEILLKNVDSKSTGENKKSEDDSLSEEVVSSQTSQLSLAPLDKPEIDVAEADTSFIEDANKVKVSNEVATSSSSSLELFENVYIEDNTTRKNNEDGSESSNGNEEEVVPPNSIKNDEIPVEDYSTIEDALKSMISDVEESNLEPLSLDSRDLNDFLSDKPEVTSSCELTFQADSFMVSSTSEDIADNSSKNILSDSNSCQNSSNSFEAGTSNQCMSDSAPKVHDDKLPNPEKSNDSNSLLDFIADSATDACKLQNDLPEKDKGKIDTNSVSTTSKTVEIVLDDSLADSKNSLQKESISSSQPQDVQLGFDKDFDIAATASSKLEDSVKENVIEQSDIIDQSEKSELPKEEPRSDSENKIAEQIAKASNDDEIIKGDKHSGESEKLLVSPKDNIESDEILEQVSSAAFPDKKLEQTSGESFSKNINDQISSESSVVNKSEPFPDNKSEQPSTEVFPENKSEQSSNEVLLENKGEQSSNEVLLENKSEQSSNEGLLENKSEQSSNEVFPETKNEILLKNSNANNVASNIITEPSSKAPEINLDALELNPTSDFSSISQKITPSFAEPFTKLPSEDMETECPDSSTVVSIGSGDNIDSFAPTPCDSGETSPSLSTPVDSCQVSAAPSPLSKTMEDDQNLTSLLDDNSLESKFMDEDSRDNLSTKRPTKTTSKKKEAIKRKGPVILDEETRMDASGNGNGIGIGISDSPMDEDSQGSFSASSKKKVRSFRCEVIVPESTEIFTADKVAEYMWPLEGFGEHYFVQEHISQYLGIMSFKRKYPDLRRRPIESLEKEYLKESGFVNEMACDLGLTAVRSEDAFDIMFNDFPSKYEELQRVLREKKELQLKEKGKVEYQLMNLDKSKLQEYGKKAAQNAARWNAAFNRERKDERRCAFDLQTFTVHKPATLRKKLPPEMTKMGFYPVAVLPGQYTDAFKQFSPLDLKGLPLQTVLSGPFTAEELHAAANANLSDDESAPASVGTCSNDKESIVDKESEAIEPDASSEKAPLLRCKECSGTKEKNKHAKPEPLIICGSCRAPSHPTCIELTLSMFEKIESYSWQCMECKTCAQCNDPDDEERMIFCDMCDRGYHIYCVGLRRVPQGRWHCKECAVCFTCGTRTPSGNEHIKNAEWQHEYKKEKDVKQLKYACTLCMPCDRYWKRRQFCYICMKVYRSIPEDGMVKCTGCPKYVHREGCSTVQDNERYCTYCFKTRNKTALNHSRIIAAAKKKMASGY